MKARVFIYTGEKRAGIPWRFRRKIKTTKTIVESLPME